MMRIYPKNYWSNCNNFKYFNSNGNSSSSTVLSWSDSDDYENVVGYNVYRVSDKQWIYK
jgi:hypothetical protein